MSSYALGRQYGPSDLAVDSERHAPSAKPAATRLTWVDMALVVLFMIGLYTNYTIQITEKIPFPSVPAGLAGLLLLWRRRDVIRPAAFSCFVGVVLLFLISILLAPDITFLSRRTNGLIQLTYSLVIGYALFLTITHAPRRRIGRLFLGFSLVILVGCLLEVHAGLRPISDAVRNAIYQSGVYDSDLRDVIFYGKARPKFFASEPASVTFCYTLFTFVWLVVSTWRWKLVAYVALVGIGVVSMPGPTLLLMLLLVLPYMLFLASRRNGRLDVGRFLLVACVALVFCAAFAVLAPALFPARFDDAMSGNDPSFFYRVRGPALAGVHIMQNYPLVGAGLTGEPFFGNLVMNVYMRSTGFSAGWEAVSSTNDLVVNFFWLHWIYLGLIWGVIMIIAIAVWLRTLGVPSPGFCWMVWAILGQAGGAYVGPACWAVLFLAGAAAVLHERKEAPPPRRASRPSPGGLRYPGFQLANPRSAARLTTRR